jgi:hypothetical protein
VVYNGVAVPSVEPEVGRDYKPDREAACGDALRRHVERGDEVVVVGGGRGLTTVIAARMTHFEGSVTVHESNSRMLETLRRTIEVNRVADLVTTVHAAIGSVSEQAAELFGPGDGERLDPSALPECDVLEMDCEGAEVEILRGMACRPRTIVVETHAPLGVPPEDVEATLDEMGYDVRERSPAGMHDELTVLTAVRQSGGTD